MPISAQALKKLRHDRRRTVQNTRTRHNLRMLIKRARTHPSKKTLTTVFRALDKAVKTQVIHTNKAARLKSRLSKLIKK
jgi:small subunit ribosomal protein S20